MSFSGINTGYLSLLNIFQSNNVNIVGLTPNTVLVVNGAGNIVSEPPMTNGQVLIGVTGSIPVPNLIGVTANLLETIGPGTILLDTVQGIQTTSSPTFNALTLTNPLPISSGGNGSTTPGITGTGPDIVITGSWPNQNVAFSGSSGVVTSVTGTAFEITASPTSGAVVLSFPNVMHTNNGYIIDDGSGNSGMNGYYASTLIASNYAQGYFLSSITAKTTGTVTNYANILSSTAGGLHINDIFNGGGQLDINPSHVCVGFLAGPNMGSASTDPTVCIGTNAGFTLGSTGITNSVMIGTNAGQLNFPGTSNTNVGYQTGKNNTSGVANTFIGANSGLGVIGDSTGQFNTAMGVNTLSALTTGSNNVVLGVNAGPNLSTGHENVIMGLDAGLTLTTGALNTLIGQGAGLTLTSSSHNVYLGALAGFYDVGTGLNTYVGYTSGQGQAGATGVQNVAVGTRSLMVYTTANNTTCVGYNAGSAITSGQENTLFGAGAGQAITTASENTAVGAGALGTTTGASNTAVGSGALGNLTTGTSNVCVGNGAGNAITTGTDNVIIGASSSLAAVGDNNEVVIGFGTIGHGSNTTTIVNIGQGLLFSSTTGYIQNNTPQSAKLAGNLTLASGVPQFGCAIAGVVPGTYLFFAHVTIQSGSGAVGEKVEFGIISGSSGLSTFPTGQWSSLSNIGGLSPQVLSGAISGLAVVPSLDTLEIEFFQAAGVGASVILATTSPSALPGACCLNIIRIY